MTFSVEELDEIVRLRMAGMTLKRIGNLYGVSEAVISYALNKCDSEEYRQYKLENHRKKLSCITKQDIEGVKQQVYPGMRVICKYIDGNGLREYRVAGVVTKTSRNIFVVRRKNVEEAFSYIDLLRKVGVQIA